jgi:hypothetical protein
MSRPGLSYFAEIMSKQHILDEIRRTAKDNGGDDGLQDGRSELPTH